MLPTAHHSRVMRESIRLLSRSSHTPEDVHALTQAEQEELAWLRVENERLKARLAEMEEAARERRGQIGQSAWREAR